MLRAIAAIFITGLSILCLFGQPDQRALGAAGLLLAGVIAFSKGPRG